MFIIRRPDEFEHSISIDIRTQIIKSEKRYRESTVSNIIESKTNKIATELGLYRKYKQTADELKQEKKEKPGEYIRRIASLVKEYKASKSPYTGKYVNTELCKSFFQLRQSQILELIPVAVGGEVTSSYKQVYMQNPHNGYIYVIVAQSWNGEYNTRGDLKVGSYVFYADILGKEVSPNEYNKPNINTKIAEDLAYNFRFIVDYNEHRYKLLLSETNIDKKIEDFKENKCSYILIEHILYQMYTDRDILPLINDANKANQSTANYDIHHEQYRFDLREGNIRLLSKDQHQGESSSSHNYGNRTSPLKTIPLYK